jgi:DNA-binding Lrp family transcriptional regulator
VAARTLAPDPIDIEILREMYREGAVNLAGIDPRLNATRVARKLRIGRSRVAARLRAWRESGFLRKYDVWLNPGLLGWHGAWVAVQVDHRRSKPGLFRRLALVDGVVAGMDFLGEWISVAVVAPDAAALDRRIGLIRNLVGVKDLDGPERWVVPEPKRPLTTLDVRIVRALRERPMANLAEIARRVGVSTRTMTRRYSALVDDWAVWFVPVFDFTTLAYPVVSLNVHVRAGLGRETISPQLREHYPMTLDFTNSQVGPMTSAQDLAFFVSLPSAAHLEDLERRVEGMEGVEHVESYVMVRTYDYPEWFDKHLDSVLGNPAPVRAKPVRARRRRVTPSVTR